MSIKQQLMEDVKTAMKAKDSARLSALRMLQSAIKNKEIEVRPAEISDQDVIQVVKKMVKQIKESIEQYKAGGRDELAEKEASELSILEVYLPEQLGEAQLLPIVDEAIASLGASSIKDMGQVIKAVQDKVAGAADGKLISQIVRSKLQ